MTKLTDRNAELEFKRKLIAWRATHQISALEHKVRHNTAKLCEAIWMDDRTGVVLYTKRLLNLHKQLLLAADKMPEKS